jgi:hypothetical protein
MVGHGNPIHTNCWRSITDRSRHGVLIATSDRILKPAKVSGRDFELLLSNLPARRGPGTEPMEVSPGSGTQFTLD